MKNDDLQQPGTGGSWEHLGRLDRFFAGPASEIPAGVRDLIQSLLDDRHELYRSGYRVSFVGVPKAGKSSLINALLGMPLLPVGATRSTHAVTSIAYGAEVEAFRVRTETGETSEERLNLSALPDVIQDESSEKHIGVRLRVPNPLLEGGRVLVDTPGLREEADTMEGIETELARSDLAVMVLSADKVLSSLERRMVRRIGRLLHGNVIFVLNRLDLIEEDDWPEVLEWTKGALQDSGNEIVGSPKLFATVAKASSGAGGEDLPILRDRLAQILSGSGGQQVAALARLGVLEERIGETREGLKASLAEAQRLTQRIREDHEAMLERERAEHKERIVAARANLVVSKAVLQEIGNTFVQVCTEDTISRAATARSSKIPIAYESALEGYTTVVEDQVRGAVSGAEVTAPAFDLGTWIFRTDVTAAERPVGEIAETLGSLLDRVVDSGSVGRDAGSNLGSWIDKNVLGVDAEVKTRRRIEAMARGVVSSLRTEAERYIDGVDSLLVQAQTFYDGWTRSSPRVIAAEREEELCRNVLKWCDAFVQEVRALVRLQLGESE